MWVDDQRPDGSIDTQVHASLEDTQDCGPDALA